MSSTKPTPPEGRTRGRSTGSTDFWTRFFAIRWPASANQSRCAMSWLVAGPGESTRSTDSSISSTPTTSSSSRRDSTTRPDFAVGGVGRLSSASGLGVVAREDSARRRPAAGRAWPSRVTGGDQPRQPCRPAPPGRRAPRPRGLRRASSAPPRGLISSRTEHPSTAAAASLTTLNVTFLPRRAVQSPTLARSRSTSPSVGQTRVGSDLGHISYDERSVEAGNGFGLEAASPASASEFPARRAQPSGSGRRTKRCEDVPGMRRLPVEPNRSSRPRRASTYRRAVGRYWGAPPGVADPGGPQARAVVAPAERLELLQAPLGAPAAPRDRPGDPLADLGPGR